MRNFTLIVCLLTASLSAKAVELNRRVFLQSLASLMGSKVLPDVAIVNIPKDFVHAAKLEFLDAFMASDWPRRCFLAEAGERAGHVDGNYIAYNDYMAKNPVEPVMIQANLLLNEIIDFESEVSRRFKLPIERVHEEVMFSFISGMDYVLPEGTRLGGIVPRTRQFAPLGYNFQDKIYELAREKWSKGKWAFIDEIFNGLYHDRSRTYYRPQWMIDESIRRFAEIEKEKQIAADEAMSEETDVSEESDLSVARARILAALRSRSECEKSLLSNESTEMSENGAAHPESALLTPFKTRIFPVSH